MKKYLILATKNIGGALLSIFLIFNISTMFIFGAFSSADFFFNSNVQIKIYNTTFFAIVAIIFLLALFYKYKDTKS